VMVLVAATLVVAFQPQSASAWFCRWRAASCWYRPPCFAPFAYRPFCYRPFYAGYCPPVYGYGFSGYGFTSYRTFSTWTPGFYSGWNYPYGCGWYSYAPVISTPAYCLPSAFVPQFGPAGVMPYLGFASTNRAALSPAVNNRVNVAAVAARPAVARPTPRATALANAVRSSNADARLRAGRLVASGDRHLRAAVDAPARLAKALDAYRRAAAIAPDQPDNYLRQAIVLTALERRDEAQAAIDRAVAIDGRLGGDDAAARAAAQRLPPVPALGDPSGPTALAARSGSLIGRIFQSGAAAVEPEVNWIADRWSQQWQGEIARLARK
jgi:hypothetical protein